MVRVVFGDFLFIDRSVERIKLYNAALGKRGLLFLRQLDALSRLVLFKLFIRKSWI